MYSQAEVAALKEQVKHLSEVNNSLKQTLEAAEAAIAKPKRDYENSQVSCQIIDCPCNIIS